MLLAASHDAAAKPGVGGLVVEGDGHGSMFGFTVTTTTPLLEVHVHLADRQATSTGKYETRVELRMGQTLLADARATTLRGGADDPDAQPPTQDGWTDFDLVPHATEIVGGSRVFLSVVLTRIDAPAPSAAEAASEAFSSASQELRAAGPVGAGGQRLDAIIVPTSLLRPAFPAVTDTRIDSTNMTANQIDSLGLGISHALDILADPTPASRFRTDSPTAQSWIRIE